MKKKGYELIKNNDSLADENGYLSNINKNLHMIVMKMNEKLQDVNISQHYNLVERDRGQVDKQEDQDVDMKLLMEENEKMDRIISSLKQQREKDSSGKTLSMVDEMFVSNTASIDPFKSNRPNTMDSRVLEKREEMLFSNRMDTSQPPHEEAFNSFRQTHHIASHRNSKNVVADDPPARFESVNAKVKSDGGYKCVLI